MALRPSQVETLRLLAGSDHALSVWEVAEGLGLTTYQGARARLAALQEDHLVERTWARLHRGGRWSITQRGREALESSDD